ncbi:hypothetical protein Lxx20060 [Leifsonia xyli subsp. xyli str. CTCB07]|uniref:N-acetyltransferase domain-containing protein n=1 Tax=Leifsonia xyli subsp. xyli (strain CTCB07) TaxID=281090 RepID=Q6AD23_LEIXX|nr:hypothetical protein Lxx20060 [Leifsonia xyli subsp. xyli str. CTCB07]
MDASLDVKRIAPALLGAVVTACREKGWQCVTLDVDAGNPTGALGLCSGRGFRETGRETAFAIEH